MQADLLTTIILPLSLFLIMLGMGLSLKLADFKAVIKSPRAISIGLFGQMILLPLIALSVALVFNLAGEIAVGLMIIAFAPGGATSNMFTYLSKGDVSLSISLTAFTSLITPFSIPLLTVLSMNYFMGENTDFELPLLKTILQLLVITIIPVSIGMFVLSRWPKVAKRIESGLKWFSIFFLILIIVLIVLKNKHDMADFFARVGLATLVLNVVVLFAGYKLAQFTKLTHAQSVSIGFEVGIQNGTLALLVAGTLIGNTNMMIPAVTYSLIMFFSGAAFSWWVKRV